MTMDERIDSINQQNQIDRWIFERVMLLSNDTYKTLIKTEQWDEHFM